MEGDFSRGHRPDGKRGKTYRRVLIQEGRALLDSDVAALVDAGERMVRDAVLHGACAAGSSDLGYLVTPGELLALFDPVEGVSVAATGGAEAVRDFSRKYLDRLPGLRLRGTGGSVSVALRRPLAANTQLRLWLRSDDGATARINGTNIVVPAGTEYAAFALTASGAALTVEPDPAGTYWVAMVETRAPAGPTAVLHWAGGHYQIGGIIAGTAAAAWPDLADPAGAAMVAASAAAAATRMVAYLEISERHVTGVEDPGIIEQALGGDHDTTTRTAVQAQVKLAAVTGASTADAIAAAIRAPSLPSGTVTLGVAAATLAADPCDLPVPGGYTGPDNRLYRLAVHSVSTAGGGETLFKWSRDNAAELFPVAFPVRPAPTDPVDSLIVGAEAPLRDGDLVELLSEATDLGDAAPGAVTATGFARPRRSQGRLLRLSGGEQVTGASRVFTLRDPLTEAPIASIDPAPFGQVGLKLRRWTGLIRRTGTGAASFELEHGIQAAIAGGFEPGDWWQYEARTAAQNANGPPVTAPHGPERLFAPLALLQATPPGQPMTLLAWLDSRYRRLCETEADAAAYDGARVGTDADTVQEALDELFLRVSDGCGEVAVALGADIQDVFDAIPAGGSAKVCLNAGTRDLAAPVTVAGKGDLIITGIGGGTLLRGSARRVLSFTGCRSVTLRDFAVAVTGAAPPPADGAILSFTDCGEVSIEGLGITSADPAGHADAAIRVHGRAAGATRRVSITKNHIQLGRGDTGILLIDPGLATIRDNVIAIRDDPFDLIAALGSEAPAVGNVLIDRIEFPGDDFDFVGGPIIEIDPPGPGRVTRRGFVFANGMWGRSVLSFTTDVRLTERTWDLLVGANVPPSGNQTSETQMRMFIRQFRSALARAMLTGSSAGVTIPAAVRPVLDRLAAMVIDSNARIHGDAGIVVALNHTALRSPNNTAAISRLFPQSPDAPITISGNRVTGFRRGIHVGASRSRSNLQVAHAVDVIENHIALRLPMQAYQRHGIFVGGALSVRIKGNRVENLAYDPTFLQPQGEPRAPVDCDGIRLWGAFGPLVQVFENLIYGTTVGLRFENLALPDPALGQVVIQNSRFFGLNAYVGDGTPQIVSA
jgi:hypothetical protein